MLRFVKSMFPLAWLRYSFGALLSCAFARSNNALNSPASKVISSPFDCFHWVLRPVSMSESGKTQVSSSAVNDVLLVPSLAYTHAFDMYSNDAVCPGGGDGFICNEFPKILNR